MKSFYLVSLILTFAWCADGQVRDFIPVNFHKADSIALSYPKHSLRNLKELATKLTAPLKTEVEKFRAIYRWTCENIAYDYVLYEKNQRQREKLKGPEELQGWYKKANALMFTALLNKQKTICTGYAYLIRELSAHAGLTCEIVDGYGRNAQSNVGGIGIPNHQWNAILLNGKWYLCDATWSSGAMLTSMSLYIKNYNDVYFLPDPALFIRNHYPIDSRWALLCDAPTLQHFLNGPVIYSQLLKLESNQLKPDTFVVSVSKTEPVVFQFNAPEHAALENITLSIKGQNDIILPPLQPDSNGLYAIRHRFSNRGTYVVHVRKDREYLFSYKVSVN
jgi:transglutaminase/protease-like cytokinesis protein 3